MMENLCRAGYDLSNVTFCGKKLFSYSCTNVQASKNFSENGKLLLITNGKFIEKYDTIQWNCALQSFPLENFHDKYDSIQEFFSIKITEPIEIDENQFDESYEIVEGNEMEFSVQVSNARVKTKDSFQYILNHDID